MIFTDTTTAAVEWALSAESARQRVTANNIANVNTPGFKSSRVAFEDSLAEALEHGRPLDAETSVFRAGNIASQDGNDVFLEEETNILTQSGIHYDALVQAFNFKIGALRSAIGR
jgi:flagellar basal-body rod protein FlgB